jgi:hypothetical protein
MSHTVHVMCDMCSSTKGLSHVLRGTGTHTSHALRGTGTHHTQMLDRHTLRTTCTLVNTPTSHGLWRAGAHVTSHSVCWTVLHHTSYVRCWTGIHHTSHTGPTHTTCTALDRHAPHAWTSGHHSMCFVPALSHVCKCNRQDNTAQPCAATFILHHLPQ